MEVETVSSTVISPNNGPTKVSQIPLTIFDRSALNMHIPVIYALAPPTAANRTLKQALLKTLAHFPTLTGRLGENQEGLPCIFLGEGHQGVLLVEAKVAGKLVDYLPLEPSVDHRKFHPRPDGAETSLQIQLSRFDCGGLVIGLTAHHRVADGQSMSCFFTAWGMAVRGLEPEPRPIYDRTWIAPRDPLRCDYQFWGVEFEQPSLLPQNFDPHTLPPLENNEVVNVLVRYSEDFIQSKLRSQLKRRYSTFEVVMAHLWKKISEARGLHPNERTQMRMAVNGRPRLNVPAEYFGNMVSNAHAMTTVKDLLEGSLAHAADLIRDSIRRIGDGYLRSFIDFGAMNEREVLVPITDVEGFVLSPNLEVDSWLGLRLDEMDFGCDGGLCGFLPGWVFVEGVVILIPTLHAKNRGDMDVIVTLLEEHARLFKQISHSLDPPFQ